MAITLKKIIESLGPTGEYNTNQLYDKLMLSNSGAYSNTFFKSATVVPNSTVGAASRWLRKYMPIDQGKRFKLKPKKKDERL